MKFALFDGILESHVGESLTRALISLGHDVMASGKITHGFEIEDRPTTDTEMHTWVEKLLDWAPDVLINLRPAGLAPGWLAKFRRKGTLLAAWFSDDPVLFRSSYAAVLPLYDQVFHCGGVQVLEFYDRHFGRSTGLNFPFWTDNMAFPRIYAQRPPTSDLIFIGNLHDGVRRTRVDLLDAIPGKVASYGKSREAECPRSHRGQLQTMEETSAAAGQVRAGLSIPQRFSDYRDNSLWFPGLDELGTFQYPSRVVQYAAMGLPVVSLADRAETPSFPEMLRIEAPEDFAHIAPLLRDEGAAGELSRRTHDRFERNFSARARALLIEAWARGELNRTASVAARAELFAEFDGREATTVSEPPGDEKRGDRIVTLAPGRVRNFVSARTRPVRARVSAPRSREVIGVLGDGWLRATSLTSMTARAVTNLGHRMVPLNPYHLEKYMRSDPVAEYRALLDVEAWSSAHNSPLTHLIIVGRTYGLRESARVATSAMSEWTPNLDRVGIRTASAASVSVSPNPGVVKRMRANGFTALHVPLAPDESIQNAVLNAKAPGLRVVGTVETSEQVADQYMSALKSYGPTKTLLDDGATLESVGAALSGNALLILPSAVARPPEILVAALACRAPLAIPRQMLQYLHLEGREGPSIFTYDNPREARHKIALMQSSRSDPESAPGVKERARCAGDGAGEPRATLETWIERLLMANAELSSL